jgi:glycosyltransferase involved in cell wall biosynthesis
MKIGIDCRLWKETGVGRYIRNLVLNLQKIDKKNEYVLFVLSRDGGEILKQVQNDKFKAVTADVKWHTLEEQVKFPQILNSENLDLVHFPYFSVPIFYNRPFVITIHDLIVDHFPTGKASTLPEPIYNLKLLGYKFVLSQAAKRAKEIIAISNATKNEIVDHLKINPQKIAVIYEGVDDKITKPKLQIPNNIQNTKYFLYVGNAFPHKNLNRLIEAFSILCHPELVSGSQLKGDSDLRQNDTKLVFVGKEDYFYKRLKEKVTLMKLSDKIIFLQNVSDEELSNLYRNALALIMPSLMEGFGLPALEAMANNCLVLASKIPALQEVCEDAAIYFDPHNINDIAEKMKDAASCDNNERRKKGLDRSKFFSWEKMAKETLKVYSNAF